VVRGEAWFIVPSFLIGILASAPMFLCMSTTVEAAGMRTLVAGQLVAYEVRLARDGRSKAIKLRLLNP
jgi:cold shock CspA family protein